MSQRISLLGPTTPVAQSPGERAPENSGNHGSRQVNVSGLENSPTPADVRASADSGSHLLLSSLRRLYETASDPMSSPPVAPAPVDSPAADPDYDLSISLLESVFELSESDPLPQLNWSDDDLALGLRLDRHRHDSIAGTSGTGSVEYRDGKNPPTLGDPLLSACAGIDRREHPRRESECTVKVCPCSSDERLAADRIAWLLHAAQLKGTLVDVSMSAISINLPKAFAAGTKVLLQIKNRMLDDHVETAAIVLRSRDLGNGEWNVVSRFCKNLTFEQIHVVGRSLFAATIV